MKRFDFPLNKILSLRIFYEKQAEIELQQATGKRDAVKMEIENIDVNVEEVSVLFSKSIEMNILMATENYVKALKLKKLQLQTKLVELEHNVKICIEKYQEALKKRKILERLKEKKMEEWKNELEKEELLSIDEVISAKKSLQS